MVDQISNRKEDILIYTRHILINYIVKSGDELKITSQVQNVLHTSSYIKLRYLPMRMCAEQRRPLTKSSKYADKPGQSLGKNGNQVTKLHSEHTIGFNCQVY